jgi:hypothetical protein
MSEINYFKILLLFKMRLHMMLNGCRAPHHLVSSDGAILFCLTFV